MYCPFTVWTETLFKPLYGTWHGPYIINETFLTNNENKDDIFLVDISNPENPVLSDPEFWIDTVR